MARKYKCTYSDCAIGSAHNTFLEHTEGDYHWINGSYRSADGSVDVYHQWGNGCMVVANFTYYGFGRCHFMSIEGHVMSKRSLAVMAGKFLREVKKAATVK